jgi:hypothetical protein
VSTPNLALAAASVKQKPIERINPGMWIRCYDGDTAIWSRVTANLQFVHRTNGRKVTRLVAVDHGTGESSAVDQVNGEPVEYITAAQARKAGLT